ncbi:MAG: hypothetical protein R2834_13840 [Rhodothermales bacterium]
MNVHQRHTLLAGFLIAIGMLLFPPQRIATVSNSAYTDDAEPGAGVSLTYRFLFAESFRFDEHSTAESIGIEWPVLRLQLQWLALITLLLLVYFRNRNRGGGDDSEDRPAEPAPAPEADLIAG